MISIHPKCLPNTSYTLCCSFFESAFCAHLFTCLFVFFFFHVCRESSYHCCRTWQIKRRSLVSVWFDFLVWEFGVNGSCIDDVFLMLRDWKLSNVGSGYISYSSLLYLTRLRCTEFFEPIISYHAYNIKWASPLVQQLQKSSVIWSTSYYSKFNEDLLNSAFDFMYLLGASGCEAEF